MHHAPSYRQRPRPEQLVFHLQPILGQDGSAPAGYEALVRWPQPDGTVRGPLAFLEPLLHGDGMEAFTRFGILRLASLLALHPEAPPLHLNLSPRQLTLPITERLLTDLRPHVRARLRIELTEQRIPDLDAYAAQVRRLARAGIEILLDDILPEQLPDRLPDDLPVAGVKFDPRTLPELVRDPGGSIARTAVRLAERGLSVTAEGIEDRSVVPALRALGITCFQGFGIAKPQPDLASALRRFPPAVRPGGVGGAAVRRGRPG